MKFERLNSEVPCTARGTPGAWLNPVVDWPHALSQALRRAPVVMRIMLASVRGSAPRESGVAMLLSAYGAEGTIGGGQLEWQALNAAQTMLADPDSTARVERLVLGADLGQCCGGVVELWIERYTRDALGLVDAALQAIALGPTVLETKVTCAGIERRLVCAAADGEASQLLRVPRSQAAPRIQRDRTGLTLWERVDEALPALWLYGAGYVGQALARIALDLPLRVTWIDSRAELLPQTGGGTIRTLHAEDPVATVSDAPPGTRFLILTHSHTLDYALCRAILTRDDFSWLGLIGSHSKSARFRARLARDGLGREAIARLICPIGVDGIRSKWPAAIAVGVAAQLLQHMGMGGDTLGAAKISGSNDACAGISCASCGAGAGLPRRALPA